MKLSNAAKILAVTLVAYVVLDFFLTPLGGIETRPVAQVKVIGVVGLVLLFTGLVLAIVSLVLLYRRSARASMVAIIAAVLYFPAFLTEVAGIFSSVRPPSGITLIEWAQAVVGILTIAIAIWMLRTSPEPR